MYELSRNRFKEMKHFCLQYQEMRSRIKMLEKRYLSHGEKDLPGDVATELRDLKHAAMLIEKTAFDIGNFPGEKILKIVTEDLPIGEVCSDIREKTICEWYVRKFYWMLSEKKGL